MILLLHDLIFVVRCAHRKNRLKYLKTLIMDFSGIYEEQHSSGREKKHPGWGEDIPEPTVTVMRIDE